MSKIYAFFYVLFFITVAQYSAAQSRRGAVHGKIVDENNNPVEMAAVILKGSAIHTSSDASGMFSIEANAGTYSLVISRVGLKSISKPILIKAGIDTELGITKLVNASAIQEVQIAGKTQSQQVKSTGFQVNVIDLKSQYNATANINQVLNRTSGVRLREEGGIGSNFTFSLNGFSGRQVKFFLDGIPMDNFGSSLTLNNFPANMAERLEVYKGVLPISLGADALGGAVNIVTRSNPNYLDASYSYGSFNTHSASLNHAYTDAKTGFTVRTNAFYNYSDNDYKVKVKPIDLVTGQKGTEQEVKRFHDKYRSAGAQIEAGVTGKKYADKLLIGLIASGNNKDIQTGVTMDQVFGARTSRSTSFIPTLKYKKTDLFIKGLDLSLYGAYNFTRNNFTDTARVKYNWLQQTIPSSTAELSRSQLKNRDNEALVTAGLAYTISTRHSIALNYVTTDFSRKSSDTEDPANVTFLYPQKLNKQVIGLALQENLDRFTANVFTKLYVLNARSFEQVNNGTGTAGYRQSSTNNTNYGYGAAAAYFILPRLQAKASYEHAYRLPEAAELLGDGLYTRRNTALKPESSDNFNLGALYSFYLNEANKINLEADYIFRNSHNFIRLDQQQTQPIDRQFINIGDVQTNGLEGAIRYSWKNSLHADVNVTYQSITDKQKTLSSTNFQGTITSPNLGYGYRIPNTPYLFGNAGIGYLFNRLGGSKNVFDVSYNLNFTQKYYLTPYQLGFNNQDIIPTQFAHNIMANYAIKNGRYNVALECRNLTDNTLFDNYLLQKPGRAFFIKLRYFISK